MYCWEDKFREIILELREREASNYMKVVNVEAITRGLSDIAVNLAILIMC